MRAEFDWGSVKQREIKTKTLRQLGARRGGQFLMLNWRRDLDDIQAAAKLSRGGCLAMLLAIMHRANVRKSAEVTLPISFLVEFGIGRSAKARLLKILETAKLINVKRA